MINVKYSRVLTAHHPGWFWFWCWAGFWFWWLLTVVKVCLLVLTRLARGVKTLKVKLSPKFLEVYFTVAKAKLTLFFTKKNIA